MLLLSQSNPRPALKSDKDQNYSPQVTITDVNGMPIKPEYGNTEGTAFFINEFKPATVKLRSGIVFEKVRARIDLCKQEVSFITDNNVEIVTSGESVKEIILTDSLLNTGHPENRDYKFRTGFPAIDNQNGLSFYQVLTEGNITLLKSTRKIMFNIK